MIDPNSAEYQHALAWFKNCNWYDHFATHDWTVKAISRFMVGNPPKGIPMRVYIARCKSCALYASLNETDTTTHVDAIWFDDDPECQGTDCHRTIPRVPCHQMRFARNNKAFL